MNLTAPHATLKELGVTPSLLREYDRRIPPYTAYPPFNRWSPAVGPPQWKEHLESAAVDEVVDLSLHVRFPFGLHERNGESASSRLCAEDWFFMYLPLVEREFNLVSRHLHGDCRVARLNVSGGTSAPLEPGQLGDLLKALNRAFPFSSDMKRIVDICPHLSEARQLATFAAHGFRTVSFGVQELSQKAQAAMSGPGVVECLTSNVETARELGFASVNVDLVYGVPQQTFDSWQRTVTAISDLRPERLSVYNYGFLPQLVARQQADNAQSAPASGQELDMFMFAHDHLCRSGYRFVGMEHYALPDDPLAMAQRNRTLHRNLLGYVTGEGYSRNVMGFGPSTLSEIRGAFAQNASRLFGHWNMVNKGALPVERGCFLTDNDRLRRHVIDEIVCNGVLKFEGPRGEQIHRLVHEEFEHLRALEADDLIQIQVASVNVTEKGRLFLRNIAHVFDASLSAVSGSGVHIGS